LTNKYADIKEMNQSCFVPRVSAKRFCGMQRLARLLVWRGEPRRTPAKNARRYGGAVF
jgi:hypothetical protein